MDKLNGLLCFLNMLEKQEISYHLEKKEDNLIVAMEDMSVLFTGDGEIVVERMNEEGKMVQEDDACLDLLLHVRAS